MTIAFDEAREIVAARLRRRWHREAGTFYVAPYGYEDADAFWVVYGAREYLVDENPLYLQTDPPLTLVSKTDGSITFVAYLDQMDRLEDMTPVGTGHPPD